MPKARTWLWIIIGFFGFCFLCVVGVAGAGYLFFKAHIQETTVTSDTAADTFNQTLARFKDQTPLIHADEYGHVDVASRIDALPTSAVKPTELDVLALEHDTGQNQRPLVRVSLPFWLLKLGPRKMQFGGGQDINDDLERLRITPEDLERIGPRLLLNFTRGDGTHVLVWTQ
jgi:hypothetical protein